MIGVLGAALLVACDPPCATAGFTADYYGSPAYTDGAGNFAWPLERAVTIHEFDPYMEQLCDVHVSFRMDLGPNCHLRAHGADGGSDRSGHFIWASAYIDGDQACSLTLDDGEATLSVAGGNMSVRGDAIELTLRGTALRATGGVGTKFSYELSGTRGP